jgi:hypothetical protein
MTGVLDRYTRQGVYVGTAFQTSVCLLNFVGLLAGELVITVAASHALRGPWLACRNVAWLSACLSNLS